MVRCASLRSSAPPRATGRAPPQRRDMSFAPSMSSSSTELSSAARKRDSSVTSDGTLSADLRYPFI
eukprot:6185490-Pleurochrysis_carterae.AAC.2